jgi:hypothetical protein
MSLSGLTSVVDKVVKQSMNIKLADMGAKAKAEAGEDAKEKLKEALAVKEEKEKEEKPGKK